MEAESSGAEDENMMHWLAGSNTKRQLSQDEIEEIVKGKSTINSAKKFATEPSKKSTNNQLSDKELSTSLNQNKSSPEAGSKKSTIFTKQTTNNSLKMKELINKKFNYLFYITTSKNLTRLQMSDLWRTARGNPHDVIIQTKKGFLLKTNTDKKGNIEKLQQLKTQKHISSFEATSEKQQQPREQAMIASYSAVIATVEQEVTDEEMSTYLNKIQIQHRYCKRILSRQTNKSTYLIRIITGCIRSFEKLLNEGLFYRNRHYPVYPSLPPPPAPLPCGRCSEFDHKTEDCVAPLKCHKCQGNHSTSKCSTELPIKCTACNSTEHAAWSFKCPKRPTKAIPDIPNIPIKSINKKSEEIDSDLKKENRIHSPITKHDFIISTYLEEINNPKNLDREETIRKIRKRFVELWKIDTTAVFTQNRLYILMFDLDSDQDSPTEPLNSLNNAQCRI